MRKSHPLLGTARAAGGLLGPYVCMVLLVTLGAPSVARADSNTASAMTWVVKNCDDGGTGSLRAIVSQAANGDTIDLAHLSCNSILLTNGTVTMPQDDLKLVGPGRSALAIDGGAEQDFQNRVITHTGTGTISIRGMTLRNAAPIGTYGGCIDSFGNVSLHDVLLSGCVVTTAGPDTAMGGGVYAEGNIEFEKSTVRNSHALNVGAGYAQGGGIFAQGNLDINASYLGVNSAMAFEASAAGGGAFVRGVLTMLNSQVVGNRATNPFLQNGYSSGGGLALQRAYDIAASTFANNFADQGGALYSFGTNPVDHRIIVNSTISSNESLIPPAGIYMLGSLEMANSTVAFNAVRNAMAGPGGILTLDDVTLQSSIVANNTVNGQASDVGAPSVTGADNIIFAPYDVAPPAGTLINVDPLLGPLGNHGGSTPTHALLKGSPALDAGNDTAGLTYDQRGQGFARVVGAFADAGAFESRPSLLAVHPETVDFGRVPAGVASASITVVVANAGDGRLQVSAIEAAQLPFTRDGGSCDVPPFTLMSNASCTVAFIFTPTADGPISQSLTVTSDSGTEVLSLSGEGVTDDLIFAAGFETH